MNSSTSSTTGGSTSSTSSGARTDTERAGAVHLAVDLQAQSHAQSHAQDQSQDLALRFDDEGMRARLTGLIRRAAEAAVAAGELPELGLDDLGIARTTDAANGDWTSTVAMRSAKAARRAPRAVAEALLAHLPEDPALARVEVAGPGFINITLSQEAATAVFDQVRREGMDYGRSQDGAGQSVNVEFVSANPVGPMHVGHGRWAALGDSLCRVLEHNGWHVTREFYINDAGHQMDVFGASVEKRYRQLCQLTALGTDPQLAYEQLEQDRVAALDDPDNVSPQTHPLSQDFSDELGADSYGGAYIIDLAYMFYCQDGTAPLDMTPEERLHDFRERAYAYILDNIKETLARCGTRFDVWFSERSLHEPHGQEQKTAVTQAFDTLRQKGLLFEKDGALWFRSTDFGDDKDRVLVKSDGSYTYFAADLAYHANKLDRGFDKLIDIWGADHHGYIPRMMAAIAALGHDGAFSVVLGQLVNLLRAGVPVRMSKRRGTMITFEELLDLVGSDATRFLLVSRTSEQQIDFDIELAQRQSADNPVYYVQYAHARICSILARAAGYENAQGMDSRMLDTVAETLIGAEPGLALLQSGAEHALARMIAGFSSTVRSAGHDRAPSRLAYYATDLAAAFHGFYTTCHVLTDDEELTRARLCACDATRRVLELVLDLIGVSAPTHM